MMQCIPASQRAAGILTLVCLAALTAVAAAPDDSAAVRKPPTGRVYFLDLRGARIVSAATDGSDTKVLLKDHRTGMDGIAIDTDGGHIYWTNMGKVKENDGSLERLNLDGTNLT